MAMTLDSDALHRATAARDRLLDLQHGVEVARVDYHDAIRRLHARGGSLREIAESLGLSHQRVHQIVEPVDGSTGRGPGRGRPRRPGRVGERDGPRGAAYMQRIMRRLRAFVGFERFTPEARDVVATAVHQAEALGHRRVGSEDLLIGTAVDEQTVAARALASLGVDAAAIRAQVTGTVTGDAYGPRRRPFTPAARRVLERTLEVVLERGEIEIRAHHVLLALLADDGDAAAILMRLGHSADAVRAAIDAASEHVGT